MASKTSARRYSATPSTWTISCPTPCREAACWQRANHACSSVRLSALVLLQPFGVVGRDLFTDRSIVGEYLGLRHPPPAPWHTGKVNNRIKSIIKCVE